MVFTSQSRQFLYRAYMLGVLVLSTGAFQTIIAGSSDPEVLKAGSPLTKIAWISIYFISLMRVIRIRFWAGQILRKNASLVAFLALISLSVLWSTAPSATLRAIVLLVLTTFLAMDLCLSMTFEQQVNLTGVALGFVIAGSIIVQLLLPSYVAVETQGETNVTNSGWSGVFATKNEFGKVIVIGLALLLSRASFRRWVSMMCAAVALGLSHLAAATGSQLNDIAIWIASSLLPVIQWKRRPRVLAVSAMSLFLLILAIIGIQNASTATQAVGKDSSLTGRGPLWMLSLKSFSKRPLLGHGWEAFWVKASPDAIRIREALNWPTAPHSHNQYIEILLGTGVAGLGAYIWILADFFRKALWYYRDREHIYRRWPLLLLVIVLLMFTTETGAVAGGGMVWILFCSTAFSMTAQQQEMMSDSITQRPEMSEVHTGKIYRHAS